MRSKKGFTLIELLVVISIIALLLSILMPALTKVKEQAKLLICKSNLHQSAIAFMTWGQDNGGQLPLTTSHASTDGKVTAINPNEMYLDQFNFTGMTDKNLLEKMVSHEGLAPYMTGFNELNLRAADVLGMPVNDPRAENFIVEGAWECPSHARKNLEDTINRLAGRDGSGRSYFRTPNGYMGRSDLWDDAMFVDDPKRKQKIAGMDPSSRQIMGGDQLYSWPGGVFIYNHGKDGASDYDWMEGYLNPPTLITGANITYGDGHVEWKKAGKGQNVVGDKNDQLNVDYFLNQPGNVLNRNILIGYGARYFF